MAGSSFWVIYLSSKLLDASKVNFDNTFEFFAVANSVIRSILVANSKHTTQRPIYRYTDGGTPLVLSSSHIVIIINAIQSLLFFQRISSSNECKFSFLISLFLITLFLVLLAVLCVYKYGWKWQCLFFFC